MRIKDVNRLRQIAVIAARHGFADLLERSGTWRRLGRREAVDVNPELQRASTARRFRMLLNDLGPTFVKFGQVLSTRADLLPAEYIQELVTLQDAVPPFPIEEVHEQIRRGLGKEVDQLFAEVDPVPLAAASIAQVHRARTLTGEQVAVKVQRPGIAEKIQADLGALQLLARLLEAVVEETGIYGPTGILEEFERAIKEELDFQHEAANVHAFLANHQDRPSIKIPKVYDELTCRQVLTLEFIAGEKLASVELTPERRTIVARHIIDAAFRQVFKDGLFHGDPHPGNLLVLPDNTVALLDFGLAGRLTRAMQQTLVMLSLAVALKDADSVARLIYRLGVPDERANLARFTADVDGILNRHLPATLGEIKTQRLFSDLLDLAVKYRIHIPKEYAILSRAAVATEGVLRSLAPDLNIMEILLPYAKELLAGQYDPTQLQGGLMRTLLRLQGLANELPVQLSQILLDLETGKFAVNVRSEQLETLVGALRSTAAIAFLGFCACGFIVGSFIAFAQHGWAVRGVPVLGVLGFVSAAVIFGGVISWLLFRNRFKKVSLRRFLPGRP